MQCFGITKAGSLCRRTTKNVWCWQHAYQGWIILVVAVVLAVLLLVA